MLKMYEYWLLQTKHSKTSLHHSLVLLGISHLVMRRSLKLFLVTRSFKESSTFPRFLVT